jgi:two-component system, NarL family, nitrate/nitrite response regulator NarL
MAERLKTNGTDMRILLADRQELVREAMAAFFEAAGLSPIKQCRSIVEMQAELVAARYDLAIVDSTVAWTDDIVQLRMAFPDVKFVLMVPSASREQIDTACRAGVVGVLPKTLSAASALGAIRRMLTGGQFDPGHGDTAPFASSYALTRRELDVLRGLFAGKSNKEIGRDLELQEVTVKLHVKTLSRKLGAKNRTHAAMIARNEGLV